MRSRVFPGFPKPGRVDGTRVLLTEVAVVEQAVAKDRFGGRTRRNRRALAGEEHRRAGCDRAEETHGCRVHVHGSVEFSAADILTSALSVTLPRSTFPFEATPP
jgi:hypothetical protein